MTVSVTTAAVDAPQKRHPDFFIVGHPKCGTSALYQMLIRQPQIHMPVKEPSFFTPEKRARFGKKADPRHPDTLEGYLSLFDGARPEQHVGEATPGYLLSRTAAARIAELWPDARIVAIFREPASFLRSFHLQALQDGHETEPDLRNAMALDEARRGPSDIPGAGRMYPWHVRYVEQLQRYHAVFPREQVLVLIYEDFRRDNEATVRRVLQFLEVDDIRPIELIEANPTVHVRHGLNDIVRSVSLGRGPAARALKTAIKTLAPQRVRRDALATIRRRVIQGAAPPPDESLMLELRLRFKGEVVAFGEYLGRDLVTLWGYDKLD